MALANRRRSALADIPIQMSELRVSTDNIANNSPLDNIPIGYLTPTPSQDESEFDVFGVIKVQL